MSCDVSKKNLMINLSYSKLYGTTGIQLTFSGIMINQRINNVMFLLNVKRKNKTVSDPC